MKKKIIIIPGILIVIVALIILKINIDKKQSEEVQSTKPDPTVYVEAYLVKDTSVIYDVMAVGTINANEQVNIVSEINKKIVAIYMKDGSYVKKGQLLFKLDDEDLQAKLKKLETQLDLAKKTEQREKIRLSKGGISQQRYDEVLNNLELIQNEINIVKVDLSKTEIKAPFNGIIGLRKISEGAWANPNIVLANLQDITQMKIDFSIPEKYANDIKIGDSIDFTTDYSTEIFTSRVDAKESQIDLKTRNITIRTIANNKNKNLYAGSSAKIKLNLKELDKSIFIPTSALIPSFQGYQLFVIKNGKAYKTNVKTGIRSQNSVQILDGLKLGDTVITTNLLKIKPEIPIKITELH